MCVCFYVLNEHAENFGNIDLLLPMSLFGIFHLPFLATHTVSNFGDFYSGLRFWGVFELALLVWYTS